MSGRRSVADSHGQQEAADRGYFAPFASAKYMLLTTFKRDGTPVSAPVPGVIDDDRAYFGVWSRSGSVRRLRHTDAVRVVPCSVWGLCTYGPPLDAIARMLPGEEASRAVGKLAPKHPIQHRFLIPLLHRTRRRQMVHYELLADDAAGSQDLCPEGCRAPDQRGDKSGSCAVYESHELMHIQCVQTHVTDHGVASIACIWPVPVYV